MKTQILQLEAHDDIISTRDKLGWGQTGRVVLVWPRRAHAAEAPRVLTRRLDLVMLQRHCARLGLQIALVTQDPDVTAHARALQLPVFKSIKQAQSPPTSRWGSRRSRRGGSWRTRRRKEAWRPDEERKEKHSALLAPRLNAPRILSKAARPLHPALRWGLFALAILSLLALGAAVLPGAQITLQPEAVPQEIRFTLIASPAHQTANLSGEIPARVYDMIVEGHGSRPASGETLVPEKAAVARVRFTNLISETVSIPAGLVISTVPKEEQPAVRFVTTEAGVIPGGVGKFISLPVRAEKPGRSGNLPANTLVAIEGPLGLKLSVTNLLPSGGGSDLPAQAPNDLDYEKLYTELLETLRGTALDDLQESLAPGDLVITPTLRLAENLAEEYTPSRPGQEGASTHPAHELRLSLRLKFEVLVVSGEDVRSLSARLLDAGLPAGYLSLPDSLQIVSAALPRVEEGETGEMESQPTVRWPVRARRLLQARVSQDQAALLARGQTARQAEGLLLARLPLDARPRVAITPAWWPRLPLLVTRISVDILE
jgi:hypothetical protein